MHWRVIKFSFPFIVFILAAISFTAKGWICFLPMIWAYIFIPLLELMIPPNQFNLSSAEEELARADIRYDLLLYFVVICQFSALIFFLYTLQDANLTTIDITGRILTMGLLCGVFGINVGHELGHRANKFEQFLAKALLLTSLYMHFFIEHNKGHHKRVATAADPASARLGESVFAFYPRSIFYSYLGAWEIANKEVRRKGLPTWSWHNEMIQYTIIELILIGLITVVFGTQLLAYYLLAAAMGIALLESVNYIEHYGLRRKEIAPGKFERALPIHSWNSNHIIGRLSLFELSRHSDHHYLASRKYQILKHHDDAPQMPTGYPSMIILAHIPPLFFYIMNQQIKHYQLTSIA